MFSEQIELRGHIIDSLTLPKVLDEILTNGGTFTIREVKIGKQRHDPSYACIDVFGPSPEGVAAVVRGLRRRTECSPRVFMLRPISRRSCIIKASGSRRSR